ncbi:MAG: oligosaccharide flippase family protein, partial [Candidatus Cloacimonetes bacterium]|nr:oligosaccharide flippase family protein [Candidatus Cloacimonadota bacterium]
MSKINLKKNIALSSLSKVLTILASFIVNWFLSRYLGPELRGKYVYLFTLNSIIWMFLELGVSKSFPYLLQSRKEDPRKLYTFSLFTMIIVGVLVTLLFTLFRPLILDVTNHEYPFYILLILGYYIVVYQFYSRTQAIQLGMDFINDYSLLALLPALIFMLALIPSFWFFPLHSRMEYSFLLNVSVFTLVLFGFQYRLNRKLKLRIRWDKLVVRSSYALGFKAFL